MTCYDPTTLVIADFNDVYILDVELVNIACSRTVSREEESLVQTGIM
jgi:hypothetical protein